ncbi:GNAT family N-acetyltransferase [Sphingosinicella terrae]|uniref:GNAT family N-acetyltransferase n=1 Tax=Sphingosinicella terrae TaxID=2172047 RepID=UPI000E0D6302|nr:GNAT family N-acetyltransferase [Sphingosinicella terrae]
MSDPDEIETPRLRLRRARAGDLDDIHAVLSDREAMRFWSTLPHESIEETRLWLSEMLCAPASASDDYVVEAAGRVIGKAGCWRLPEIGFILHSSQWRRGYAREALQALVPRIFARSDIPAITADVDPRNQASLGLLRGLGFVETGRAARTWNIGGIWCDSIYLALARAAAQPDSPNGTADDLRAPLGRG